VIAELLLEAVAKGDLQWKRWTRDKCLGSARQMFPGSTEMSWEKNIVQKLKKRLAV
jgi:hypothetical protein